MITRNTWRNLKSQKKLANFVGFDERDMKVKILILSVIWILLHLGCSWFTKFSMQCTVVFPEGIFCFIPILVIERSVFDMHTGLVAHLLLQDVLLAVALLHLDPPGISQRQKYAPPGRYTHHSTHLGLTETYYFGFQIYRVLNILLLKKISSAKKQHPAAFCIPVWKHWGLFSSN